MTGNVEEMMKRADALYSSSQQAQHSGIYVVQPPPQTKPSELDEAKALIIAFFKELPDILLTLAAMLLLLTREGWRWLSHKLSPTKQPTTDQPCPK